MRMAVMVVTHHDRRTIIRRTAPTRDPAACKPIFVELKSRAGVASKAQKQIRAKLKPAGADWWLARSARAALMALHLSGVVFRRKWKPPRLKPWEGPFADPNERLPQAPDVAARRRAAGRRSRERQRQNRETASPVLIASLTQALQPRTAASPLASSCGDDRSPRRPGGGIHVAASHRPR